MKHSATSTGPGELRIIAGAWRGRKFPVLPLAELRPTTDRIRETLFNWLQPVIAGARCLDAFAGSGLLGLEALSRGAASVCFVDKNPQICKAIQNTLRQLACEQGTVYCSALPNPRFHEKVKQGFDVIFLDPPYQQALLLPTLNWLVEKHLLHANALIFFEHAKSEVPPWDPAVWTVYKSQTAGQVHFGLLTLSELS